VVGKRKRDFACGGGCEHNRLMASENKYIDKVLFTVRKWLVLHIIRKGDKNGIQGSY
jgi:hypothetical protein